MLFSDRPNSILDRRWPYPTVPFYIHGVLTADRWNSPELQYCGYSVVAFRRDGQDGWFIDDCYPTLSASMNNESTRVSAPLVPGYADAITLTKTRVLR